MLNRSDGFKREEYKLHSNRTSDIVQVVQQVLSTEAYKVVIESDRVIAYRGKSDDDLEEFDVTLDGALRNSHMIEYSNSDPNPFEVVFDMFSLVSANGLHPVCWATGMNQESLLERWFTVKERGLGLQELTAIIGVPIVRLKTLPEDSLILSAAKYTDATVKDIVYSVKTTIEVRNDSRNPPNNPIDNPVRDDPKRDRPAARELAPVARASDGGSWVPPSFLGALTRVG